MKLAMRQRLWDFWPFILNAMRFYEKVYVSELKLFGAHYLALRAHSKRNFTISSQEELKCNMPGSPRCLHSVWYAYFENQDHSSKLNHSQNEPNGFLNDRASGALNKYHAVNWDAFVIQNSRSFRHRTMFRRSPRTVATARYTYKVEIDIS